MGPDRRVALVSGGASGIGRAVAFALARQGRSVAVADIQSSLAEEVAKEIRAAGGRAEAVAVDLTDRESVETALRSVQSGLGPVDILVNNAGWEEWHAFVDTDEEFWERILDVNFKGHLRLTKGVLPGMIERGWGRIVNVSSDAGRVGSSLEAVYSGAKGGMIAFTKTLAREVARRGITANSVCPGPTDTPLLASVSGGDRGPRILEALVKAVPMRRLAQPDDVAAAIAFFASDSAGYITGQTLSVNGGLTMI
ncbi:MAG: SDR family NAD(P)-dependent oxidoreductase [Acidimicrobiia bacterium]